MTWSRSSAWRARCFTKAAAKLGMSQSSLSHLIRDLETRLGIRLLTRSVSATDAGQRLLSIAAARLEEVDREFGCLRELRDKPSGSIGSPRPTMRPITSYGRD